MSADVVKHLEFIQAVIGRMNTSSFLIKGWAVTLVAALFALAAKDANVSFAIVAYLPIVLFWALDGIYLSQERRYRALFKDVASGGGGGLSAFEMDASGRGGANASWPCSVLAGTVAAFYGALLLVTLVVMLVLSRAVGH